MHRLLALLPLAALLALAGCPDKMPPAPEKPAAVAEQDAPRD